MQTIQVNQVKLFDDAAHVLMHIIEMPDYHEKGWYHKTRSFNAFFFTARCKDWKNRYLYRYQDFREGDLRHPDQIERDEKLPRVRHKSLYDFYDYIGYDRKRKKYAKS